MSIKRYEWVACDEHSCHCDVVESVEGDMVGYEDYAALEAKCAALAAENAGLKALARGWANATDDRLFEEHGEIFHDLSMPVRKSSKQSALLPTLSWLKCGRRVWNVWPRPGMPLQTKQTQELASASHHD
ncbi:hypothetical protein QLG09_17210 [Enterobacter sp. V89_11]|uniref:hypothetical protein n=1 Tax=Enterobacter sp. V89_11 TaxID=3044237 RepID=UPI00249F2F5D|nr:hypothetical protein [Enterobacter sp. V89_11]MDI3450584.1 hypothetical protein [Enterobacter sp. V89_11]